MYGGSYKECRGYFIWSPSGPSQMFWIRHIYCRIKQIHIWRKIVVRNDRPNVIFLPAINIIFYRFWSNLDTYYPCLNNIQHWKVEWYACTRLRGVREVPNMISYTQMLSGNAINGVCQILTRERPAMIWPGKLFIYSWRAQFCLSIGY